jgi:hypothetical protein
MSARTVRLIGGPKMGTVMQLPQSAIDIGMLYVAAMPSSRSYYAANQAWTLTVMRGFYTPSKNPDYWAFRGYR